LTLAPETDVKYLKGVGEKRAALYLRLGILTIRDLLYHFPRDYTDLSSPYCIGEAPAEEPCAIRATLTGKSPEQRIRKGLSIFKLTAEDETGELMLTVFNSRYTVENLAVNKEYIFYGKAQGGFLRREMPSPDIYPADSPGIVPVYPQTAGLSSVVMRRNIKQALEGVPAIRDPLPLDMRERLFLPGVMEALGQIHFPQAPGSAKKARERFIFEELLILSLALMSLRSREDTLACPMSPADMSPFYASLPFSPTAAQRRCIDEATADLALRRPMNRLIQGDVGSGKTLVAVACAFFAAKNSKQTAVMVPTEILAEQHLFTMRGILEPLGLRVELLTGSPGPTERRRILAGLALGEVDLVVGTHALLSEGVSFAGLGLVVTDEQHRFGVAQRARLSQKSRDVHVLVMSATPIPRTLSLIIYGDLSVSVLDEKPPGRQEVETLLISSQKRARALGFIRDALGSGRQAYIVCPLIEQGEALPGLRPAVEYAGELSQKELKGFRVGLLHGKMKPKDKEDAMRRFKNGETQVLVSTTVVEVGVDVPNAAIIMIENAERFGLSQLHQLRGRVGRSAEKSWCILVSDSRGGITGERLRSMKREHDGFKIAEQDLRLRGPGDFFGSRQHGLPVLRVADLADDLAILGVARHEAERLLEKDPCLSLPGHRPLAEEAERMMAAVGERPN
jgi:ATP-dependent DNA helicase RecG